MKIFRVFFLLALLLPVAAFAQLKPLGKATQIVLDSKNIKPAKIPGAASSAKPSDVAADALKKLNSPQSDIVTHVKNTLANAPQPPAALYETDLARHILRRGVVDGETLELFLRFIKPALSRLHSASAGQVGSMAHYPKKISDEIDQVLNLMRNSPYKAHPAVIDADLEVREIYARRVPQTQGLITKIEIPVLTPEMLSGVKDLIFVPIDLYPKTLLAGKDEYAEEMKAVLTGKNIVMAHDKPEIMFEVLMGMREHGASFAYFETGAELMEYLRGRALKGENADVILLDKIFNSGESGMEVLRALRANGFAQPVLFVMSSGYIELRMASSVDVEIFNDGDGDVLHKSAYARAVTLALAKQHNDMALGDYRYFNERGNTFIWEKDILRPYVEKAWNKSFPELMAALERDSAEFAKTAAAGAELILASDKKKLLNSLYSMAVHLSVIYRRYQYYDIARKYASRFLEWEKYILLAYPFESLPPGIPAGFME
jgi:CheY-like chemotaxis protein